MNAVKTINALTKKLHKNIAESFAKWNYISLTKICRAFD